jgi:site-specific recombinase XerD
MSNIFRKSYTLPIPAGAEMVTIKGVPSARFKRKGKGKTITVPLTEKGGRVRVSSPYFYGTVDGKPVRLFTDAVASQQRLAELVRKSEFESVGIVDRFVEHRKRPLTEHLDDFRAFLKSRDNTSAYADKTMRRVRAVIDGCGFERIDKVQASAVVEWLANQRSAGEFSITTSNYYLRDTKAFFRWCVRDRRATDNPLAHLSPLNSNVEQHRERRTLAPDEFFAVIEATRTGPVRIRLSGYDRVMLYLVAAYTGFRASELASVTPKSFNLEADPPTLTVRATHSKRRRTDVQPLRADLAELLGDYLQGKSPADLVWPGSWWRDGAAMIQADMQAATAMLHATDPEHPGIPSVDDDGRVFDFHGLRHQFISNLATAGVHPKAAQMLARHSTITLTMDRYTHLGLVDQTAALDKLPSLPSQGGNAHQAMKATGTDGALAPRLPFPCRDDDETSENMRKREERRVTGKRGRGEAQSLATVGHDDPCERKMMPDDECRPRGGMADTGDLKSPGG